MVSAVWLCLILTAAVSGQAPTKPESDQYVEVTTTNFLAQPRIVSTNLKTFGVRLGMTRSDAIEALGRVCQQCPVRLDGENTYGEIAVVTTDGQYRLMTFHIADGKVDWIRWDRAMENYLAGESGKLLTADAFTPDSPIRLRLLGREDNATHVSRQLITLVETVTFVYGKEGLQMEQVLSSVLPPTLSIALTTPARAR